MVQIKKQRHREPERDRGRKIQAPVSTLRCPSWPTQAITGCRGQRCGVFGMRQLGSLLDMVTGKAMKRSQDKTTCAKVLGWEQERGQYGWSVVNKGRRWEVEQAS